MPVGIASGSLGRIGLGIYPLLLAILHNQGTSTLTTYLAGQLSSISTIGCMAIETSSRQGSFCHDSRFIKGMDIALIDADVATHFVAGSDTAIGQTVIIQPIRTHHHLEILI